MEEKTNIEGTNESRKTAIYKGDCILIAVFAFFFIVGILAPSAASAKIVNTIALAIMGVFIIIGGGFAKVRTGMKQLRILKEDAQLLDNALAAFREDDISSACERFEEEYEEGKYAIQTPMLDASMREFLQESSLLYSEGTKVVRCDLTDYVNDDLVSEVGNANFNEFVSSVMTGLGILGTFVGLAIGLQSFHTENSEAMEQSISPLIEGIKAAFYTSIFGVSLSLIYGTIYRSALSEAMLAVSTFTTNYEKLAGLKPEHDVITKLLKNEEDQTMSMNQFAEQIAIAINDAMSGTLNALPGQIAQAVEESVSNPMNEVSRQLGDLSQNLIETVSQKQSDGVGEIVTMFVDQMKQIMGDQFDQVSESISTICKWQEETIGKLDAATVAITEREEKIAATTHMLEEVVTSLDNLVKTIEAEQKISAEQLTKAADLVTRATINIEKIGNEMAEITERSGEIIQTTADIAKSVKAQEAEIQKVTSAQVEELKACTTVISKQAAGVEKACAEAASGMNSASERMQTTSEKFAGEMEKAMERSYAQFDSQLAKAMGHFSGTLATLRDVTEKIPKATDMSATRMQKSMDSAASAIQSATDKYVASMERGKKDFDNRVRGILENLDKTMRDQTDLLRGRKMD